MGLDLSDFQGHVTQATWNNIAASYSFAYVRSSRGGTTGTYNESNSTGTGAMRYDDLYFADNIARASAAGILTGFYHYDRADVTTNTGTDEADHMLQVGGNYMKPGFLLPVLDLEAGSNRNAADLTQFSLDFINEISAQKGIVPIVYTNSSYNNDEVTATLAFTNTSGSPHTGVRTYQWLARPEGDLLNGDPVAAAGYPDPYGVWDPNFTTKANSTDPAVKPWVFWQNGSQGISSAGTVDLDAANGNLEFVKDFLVPALWTSTTTGDWATIANWNSDNPAYVSTNTSTGPAPRLPNSLDTVRLTNTAAGMVTLSTGTQSIRKLYTQQPLNITGGSLTIGYIPGSGGLTDIPSEFAATVTISGSATYTPHTSQIDSGAQFIINGGTVKFSNLNLLGGSTVTIGGNATLSPYNNAGTSTITGSSSISLGSTANTLTISDGSAAVDVEIAVPIVGSAPLQKLGTGTLQLDGSNTYSGATNVSAGILLLAASNSLSGTSGVTTLMPSSTGGTVQLSNNISINRSLAIGGAGEPARQPAPRPGSIGALDNLSGTNTWAGSITLNGTGSSAGDPLLNQIGATAGILTVSGVIQNGTGTHLAKTGNGDVVLTGSSPNTYSGMTRVMGGRLILEKDFALGSAGSDTTTSGNTFQLAGSNSTIAFRAPASSPAGFTYGADEWIHLDGNGGGSAGLGQLDNLGGANTFAGKIGLSGTTVAGMINCSLGVSVGSLELSGGIYARSTSSLPRNITKLGVGTLVISGDSNAAPTNASDASLTASTFNVGAGTVQLKSPSPTTTNLPGVMTWKATGIGVLQVTSGLLQTSTVSATGGGVISLKSGGGKTLRVSTVTVGAGSKIDLTDNKMIVDYTSASPLGVWSGSYNGITGQIATGRADGTWTGPGIITSMTAALGGSGPITTVGVAEASDALGFTSGAKVWKGQTVDATTVLALYTYAGDANLDGRVNADDYFEIDSNYNKPQSAAGYFKGDFNYDGKINGDDYYLIDMNFDSQSGVFQGGAPLGGAPLAGVSVVPEPTAIGILALPALAALRRRRGRRTYAHGPSRPCYSGRDMAETTMLLIIFVASK